MQVIEMYLYWHSERVDVDVLTFMENQPAVHDSLVR